jgi:hypothetical protein
MPATNKAPHVSTSTKTIKLVAYQRKPFIRQIQNPHEAMDPYITTSNHRSAEGLGGGGRVGFGVGFTPSTPTAIAAAKKTKWHMANQ